MKNLLFVLLLIISQTTITQNKAIKVHYYKALKNITDKTNSSPSKLHDLNYHLLVNESESLFFLEKKLNSPITESNLRFIGRGGGDGMYYTSLKDTIDVHQKEYRGKMFTILKDSDKFKWKITNEKKIISSYTCYKATSTLKIYSEIRKKVLTQNLTVWFTPEIPVFFGPAGYDGLPGLVLEAQNGGVFFIAEKIEFNLKIEISKPNKGKVVSEKEFNKIVAKSFESRYGRNKKG